MKLIKFGAPWCASCKKLSKMIEAERLTDIIEVEEIDVEDDPDKADDYAVQNLPTMLLVGDDGMVLNRWSGIHPGILDEVKAVIK